MFVYILTAEQTDCNSACVGVYLDKQVALEALKKAPDPAKITCPDYLLTEWDTDTNKRCDEWWMVGQAYYSSPGERRLHFKFEEYLCK